MATIRPRGGSWEARIRRKGWPGTSIRQRLYLEIVIAEQVDSLAEGTTGGNGSREWPVMNYALNIKRI
jgi:hypothetical protein